MKLRENPELKPCRNERRSVVCLNPECHYIQASNTTNCPRCGETWVYVTRAPVPPRKHTTRFKAFLRMVSRTYAHWQGKKEYGWAQRYNYGCPREVAVKPLLKHELECVPRHLKPRRRKECKPGRVVPGAKEMILGNYSEGGKVGQKRDTPKEAAKCIQHRVTLLTNAGRITHQTTNDCR